MRPVQASSLPHSIHISSWPSTLQIFALCYTGFVIQQQLTRLTGSCDKFRHLGPTWEIWVEEVWGKCTFEFLRGFLCTTLTETLDIAQCFPPFVTHAKAPGDLKTLMARLSSIHITSECLGAGARHQHFLKIPMWYQCAAKFENQ